MLKVKHTTTERHNAMTTSTINKIAKIKSTDKGFNVEIPYYKMTKEIERMETSTIIHKLFPGDVSFGVATTKRTEKAFVIICYSH